MRTIRWGISLALSGAVLAVVAADNRATSAWDGTANSPIPFINEQARCPEGSYLKSAVYKPNQRQDKLVITCAAIVNGAPSGSAPLVSSCLPCVPGIDGNVALIDATKSSSAGFCVYRQTSSPTC